MLTYRPIDVPGGLLLRLDDTYHPPEGEDHDIYMAAHAAGEIAINIAHLAREAGRYPLAVGDFTIHGQLYVGEDIHRLLCDHGVLTFADGPRLMPVVTCGAGNFVCICDETLAWEIILPHGTFATEYYSDRASLSAGLIERGRGFA